MIVQPFRRLRSVWIATCLIAAGLGAGFERADASQELRMAHLGTCPLESGEMIEDCVLGYRTVGELNSEGSNAVLLPAWGGGTSEQKLEEPYVGPNGWVAPDTDFIIVVDAFGNGVPSSPSNSRTQPGAAFPVFTVRDIVHAQHRLLTAELGLEGLRAVAGISLGAMVAFEWAATYPDFVGDCGQHALRPECEGEEIAAAIRELLEGAGGAAVREARSEDTPG